ncbi:AsnC family transcriptional regulator protein [Marine Group I thaumarchaeote SCGC RSA3]|uniref:AsnC family transcriptional regulator protein n=3 Tax=Marine Group I TaxID=905826 RepID=A0A081RLK3_9ARCH|nr:AsnC family transcriptional regulator protein [Marine Group I thaumarchaeote SCGC AAA799-N04]KFM15273.1 AsnC family transcriptional regulator protein [Marine Group I thaumarchaeote SCGC AAA799-D11]KFM16540.1 AsnC family transcriptional regulator protein [Marine Group I thaumarchaeote SCGC RSA3]
MNCEPNSEKDCIATLKKIPGVREAHGTLGLYDIIAQIELDTDKEIQDTTGNIRKMPKIRSTMTLTRSESGELFQPSEKLIGAMLGQNLVKSYIVIHCDKGEEYPILKDLSHIPEVKEADVIFGLYDVICKVESSSNEILDNVITKAIRKIPHIVSSMTLNVIPEQS